MRVNMDWLRDFVAIEDSPERLAERLTTSGLEVDGVEPVAPEFRGVVVAEIRSLQPHPNADKLSLCTVFDGAGEREIVCGAPNVAPGLKVPLAPVGATLPDGRKIKAAKIRGHASEGMLCSAKELGLNDETAGLLVLDAAAVPGVALGRHLKLDDAVLDVDLTPNRGDCFSVLGIAREIAAKAGIPLELPAFGPVAPASNEIFPVELVAREACPRFAGRVVRGVDAGARTPDWLKERLRRAGLRPIHPVVDVTNYVMLEVGQPLHAYDLAKLDSGIRVRWAADGERVVLLDESEVELADDMLVITDASGPIGLAGIMGGSSTAVDASTTDVFFEAAFFAQSAIQGRARRVGLHTDASARFERGVDPEGQERAIERATGLLLEIAGGVPGPVVLVEDRAHVPERHAVRTEHAHIEAVLGVALEVDDVEGALRRLGMSLERRDNGWLVTPPSYRFDISIPEDVVEEVGRMIGYDEIPAVPGTTSIVLGTATETRVLDDQIADLMVARGYSEVITYSFIDERSQALVNPGTQNVRLANPISSDLGVMRRSLWPGLLRSARQNLSRQQARCRLFEIGTRFVGNGREVAESGVVAGIAVGPNWPEQWGAESREVDFFDVKRDVEILLALSRRASEFRFERGEHPALNPSQTASIEHDSRTVGWLGTLHPKLRTEFGLKADAVLFSLDVGALGEARVPKAKQLSKFPTVRRDLAMVVDESVPVAELVRLVEKGAGECLKDVTVFDVYRGKGLESSRKSIGLGLILQDASRTLTDEDADGMVDSVVHLLEQELGATIRT